MADFGRCRVLVFADADAERTQGALVSARDVDASGIFSEFDAQLIAAAAPDPEQTDSVERFVAARNGAVRAALADGFDWVFLLEGQERLARDAFAMLGPSLARFEAIWGGLGLIGPDDGASEVPPPCRFCCQRPVEAFHMALHWWVGRSHMVKASAAARATLDAKAGESWFADYLVRQWEESLCLKTAQPITTGRKLPELSKADRDYLIEDLNSTPRFLTVFAATGLTDRAFKLAYTGINPTIERVQMRGGFYEASELEALGERLSPDQAIVDIGANTGNHTVFFAGVVAAKQVVAIEPGARAGAALRAVVAENDLRNVDLSLLGKAAGASRQFARLETGRRGHLGTARLAGEGGDIEIAPLDELLDGRLSAPLGLIKIDVEGMEIEVLDGARETIARHRPLLMIEVRDNAHRIFLNKIAEIGYRVTEIFPDYGYANYLVEPAG